MEGSSSLMASNNRYEPSYLGTLGWVDPRRTYIGDPYPWGSTPYGPQAPWDWTNRQTTDKTVDLTTIFDNIKRTREAEKKAFAESPVFADPIPPERDEIFLLDALKTALVELKAKEKTFDDLTERRQTLEEELLKLDAEVSNLRNELDDVRSKL